MPELEINYLLFYCFTVQISDFPLCVKFNLYASQYFKYVPCHMQSISQLSVILHCLCYVIIISYLALHCPNSAPNHSYGISQIAQFKIYVVSL